MQPFSIGGIAQLVERLVRNEKARGSNPLTSKCHRLKHLRCPSSLMDSGADNVCQVIQGYTGRCEFRRDRPSKQYIASDS
jgi:hypothetical protein